jgi:hypothetical protein
MLRFPGSAKRKRRNLASAFVGEVSAIMTLIEEIARPRPDVEQPGNSQAHLAPGCDLYKANAGRLDVFDAPLPSQLTHFYTRIASLPELLRAHSERVPAAEGPLANSPAADPEFEHILFEGENLLRNLRPFVSKRRPATISRA